MASKKNGNSAGVKKSLPPINAQKGVLKKTLGAKKGSK